MTMKEPDDTSGERGTDELASVNMQALAESVMEELIDHICRGLCHQTHRAAKLGYLSLEESVAQEEQKYRMSHFKLTTSSVITFFNHDAELVIVDRQGQDVFGESSATVGKKSFDCVCPHCDRTLVAQRFAPHLEKCMGMGRNSSRIASKRIANTGKAGADSDLEDCDKSSDNDWNEKPVLKKPRKKRDRPTSMTSNGLLKKVHKKHEGGGTVLLRNASGQFTSAAALANGSSSSAAADRKSSEQLRIKDEEFQF